jgi:hypothetical protein
MPWNVFRKLVTPTCHILHRDRCALIVLSGGDCIVPLCCFLNALSIRDDVYHRSRAIAQAVSYLLLTAEARFRAQVVVDKVATGTGFCSSLSVLRCQHRFTAAHIHTCIKWGWTTKGPLAAHFHGDFVSVPPPPPQCLVPTILVALCGKRTVLSPFDFGIA